MTDTPQKTEKAEFDKTRDSANKADMTSSPALQDDALTSADGEDMSVEQLNKKLKQTADK